MITKSIQVEYQVENARLIEDEMEQNRREVMHKSTIHFDPAKSKTVEQVAHQVNLGKAAEEYLNQDIPVD